MFKEWPLGNLPKELSRPELEDIKKSGYNWTQPHEVVSLFEDKVAKFCGSKYAIAVDTCTHALFLVLKYINQPQKITIPSHTYVSVPMYIKHAGYEVDFVEKEWSGLYQLEPLNVWDSAGRWTENMYVGGFQVLSFQLKKRLPIGKGGMILCDDYNAYQWFKKVCYDGRDLNVPYNQDDIELLGWHYYMTPEDAARGILLMDLISNTNEDSHNNNSYPNLKDFKIFK